MPRDLAGIPRNHARALNEWRVQPPTIKLIRQAHPGGIIDMSETAAQQPAKESQKTQTFTAKAFAAQSPTSALAPFAVQRRSPRPQDVQIQILYCGVCHSDLHQTR